MYAQKLHGFGKTDNFELLQIVTVFQLSIGQCLMLHLKSFTHLSTVMLRLLAVFGLYRLRVDVN